MHPQPHPLAGTHIRLKPGTHLFHGQDLVCADGRTLHVEDWWDRLTGGSWQSSGVLACYAYTMRGSIFGLPIDDEVVYVKDHETNLAHLVHINEIEES